MLSNCLIDMGFSFPVAKALELDKGVQPCECTMHHEVIHFKMLHFL